ncbi:MAG: HAMP domain-containing histidine kinase [Treponema sp.]|nr:HAMP domain-containing histidine kinase [Treponema sp.]
MKIRSQFAALVVLIVAIPLSCVIYFPIYHYFTSSERMLIEESNLIPEVEQSGLSQADVKRLGKLLHNMPADVQTAVFSSTFDVITSNIPELENVETLDYDSFWNFVEDKRFIYQFRTMQTENSNLVIVTRMSHKKAKKTFNATSILIILLFSLVFICVLTVVIVSRTVFKSIELIEKQTQEIAGGNLSTQITTLSKNKNEITSITDSLEKMRLSLEDAQTRRNKFIMGISHDLRTPVAIIKGYTEAISDGMVKPEEMESTLNLISCKTSQLENMIDTLINFMKLDTSDWRDNLKPGSITKLIEDFARDCCITGTVFKKNVTQDVIIKNDIQVPLDPQLVTRCFENLFSNAIRYTKDRGDILIWAREYENELVLKIIDSGEGMSKEDMDHIFDLFYRGTTSRREEGMGIGLSVVKSIITIFNWKIDVESELGNGSTFTITIPKRA